LPQGKSRISVGHSCMSPQVGHRNGHDYLYAPGTSGKAGFTAWEEHETGDSTEQEGEEKEGNANEGSVEGEEKGSNANEGSAGLLGQFKRDEILMSSTKSPSARPSSSTLDSFEDGSTVATLIPVVPIISILGEALAEAMLLDVLLSTTLLMKATDLLLLRFLVRARKGR
jgi:hypothetical protein